MSLELLGLLLEDGGLLKLLPIVQNVQDAIELHLAAHTQPAARATPPRSGRAHRAPRVGAGERRADRAVREPVLAPLMPLHSGSSSQ